MHIIILQVFKSLYSYPHYYKINVDLKINNYYLCGYVYSRIKDWNVFAKQICYLKSIYLNVWLYKPQIKFIEIFNLLGRIYLTNWNFANII